MRLQARFSRSATLTAATSFPCGRAFVEAWNVQGPAHHCAVGVGHLAPKLSKLARLLRMDMVQVR